jgi:hypothetical protein
MFYAQLNQENICIGISQLKGEVENPQLIPLKDWDTTLLGKEYRGETWVNPPSAEDENNFFSTEEILMQTLTDIEINTLQAQQERQLLAQQLADIEIALLSGGELHV